MLKLEEISLLNFLATHTETQHLFNVSGEPENTTTND